MCVCETNKRGCLQTSFLFLIWFNFVYINNFHKFVFNINSILLIILPHQLTNENCADFISQEIQPLSEIYSQQMKY
jgi:hypothetical protein